ncbi:MAG: ATP-binding protein, partial [Myxococcota bacterium]
SLYGIGIKVFDIEGNKIVDVRASTGDHCGYLFTVHKTQVMCTNLVNQIKACEIGPNDAPKAIDCFSGLRYEIVPLVYDGSLLGHFIFGPFAPEPLNAPPESLRQYEPELNIETLAGFLRVVPRAGDDTIQKVLEHLTQVFGVIIHSSYRTQITSKLHIASITGAFEDLERSNRELKNANQKLQDLDRLKSNFIATVSHELRTPLTSVIGYSEMLLEGLAGDLGDEQRDYVTTILEKGESLLNLIGQVLDLSRIESGNVFMVREKVQVRDIIELALSDIRPQAERRRITLEVDVNEDLQPIMADRDKFRRVLTNLLGNAVKFTPELGTISVKADVYEVPPEEGDRFDMFEPERNRHMQLQIIDTGIGIHEDKLEQIFDAFYQVDNTSTREFGGTGLGLTIVRNFITAHGGRITVKSTVGSGSTFTVVLPYVLDDLTEGVGVEMLSGVHS